MVKYRYQNGGQYVLWIGRGVEARRLVPSGFGAWREEPLGGTGSPEHQTTNISQRHIGIGEGTHQDKEGNDDLVIPRKHIPTPLEGDDQADHHAEGKNIADPVEREPSSPERFLCETRWHADFVRGEDEPNGNSALHNQTSTDNRERGSPKNTTANLACPPPAPNPVTARPNTSTAKEGATADNTDPISKRRMEKRKKKKGMKRGEETHANALNWEDITGMAVPAARHSKSVSKTILQKKTDDRE
ncbi:6262_t:CDS:2, partial [Acaulospora colombiana]